MAAAAALFRSRGVAGGLFTLLCLVCLASSFIDNKKLEDTRENVQKLQQGLDEIKAQRASMSELMSGYMSYFEPMMALVKKHSGEYPDELQLLGFMDTIKSFIEESKTFADGYNEMLDAKIAKSEKELGKFENIIKALEEYNAEL